MPDVLALPIVVTPAGQLRRASEIDSVIDLIGVMAMTEAEFWPHATWFGLREKFESAKRDVQDLPQIAEAINGALRELGCDTVRVHAVRNQDADQNGDRHFDIVLIGVDGNQISKKLST